MSVTIRTASEGCTVTSCAWTLFDWGTVSGTFTAGTAPIQRTDPLPQGTESPRPVAAPPRDPDLPKRAQREPLLEKLALLEREIALLRADRSMMTNDAVDDRLAQIHARVKEQIR